MRRAVYGKITSVLRLKHFLVLLYILFSYFITEYTIDSKDKDGKYTRVQ